MNFLLLSIALNTVLLFGVQSNHDPLNYKFSNSLHLKYTLHWNLPANGRICMAVDVETLGWVGFGLSLNGGMIGSDIMMAWVIDGVTTISDRYAEMKSLPVEDTQQDFELVEGYEENGRTVIEFCRKLITCDEKDREISGTSRIVFSWSDNDPNPVPTMHTNRGMKSLILIGTFRDFTSSLPANTKQLHLTIGNYIIPHTVETSYWCRVVPFQQPSIPHHIIRIGVQLDPRTIEYLHHIVVFKCRNTYTEMFGNCGDPTSNITTSGAAPDCHTFGIIAGWAVGGSSIDFPLDAGILLGPDETFHSFLLEIHYDNSQMDVGKVDDSGLIFYYTETLRQHNVGQFHMGHFENEHMQIPPGAESFLVQGYCPPACTDFDGDIKVIISGIHSHSAGIELWTQIIRDKKEIGYLNINRNYDFEYQEAFYHEDPITIKPGDALITNCLYKTKSRQDFTIGGPTLRDENCLNLFYYYPRKPFHELCLSWYNRRTSFNSALDSFQCNNVDVDGSTTFEELISNARNIQWTDKIARTLEVSQLVDTSSQNVACGTRSLVVNLPKPGIDYEVYPYRRDICGNYNGTYYAGGDTADYYYNCSTNQPYFDPIGEVRADASSLASIPKMAWLLALGLLVM